MTISNVAVNDGQALVMFTRNSEIQQAFDAVIAALPQKWAERGRIDWTFLPIDERYGDPLSRGYIGCAFGPGKRDRAKLHELRAEIGT